MKDKPHQHRWQIWAEEDCLVCNCGQDAKLEDVLSEEAGYLRGINAALNALPVDIQGAPLGEEGDNWQRGAYAALAEAAQAIERLNKTA